MLSKYYQMFDQCEPYILLLWNSCDVSLHLFNHYQLKSNDILWANITLANGCRMLIYILIYIFVDMLMAYKVDLLT